MRDAIEALGDDADELFVLLAPWGAAVRDAKGYPAAGPHDLADAATTVGAEIKSVRRMQTLGLVPSDAIQLCLGLFCSGNFTFGEDQRRQLADAGGFRWEDVSKVNIKDDFMVHLKSGEIKTIAMQYQVPIVAAAQLNRSMGLTKEPAGPEALAQSDAIGQDADAVITLRQMSQSVLQMKLAKYRHGLSDFKWYCEFRPTQGTFKEVTYERAQELRDEDNERADNES
jgi:hypothetical protein